MVVFAILGIRVAALSTAFAALARNAAFTPAAFATLRVTKRWAAGLVGTGSVVGAALIVYTSLGVSAADSFVFTNPFTRTALLARACLVELVARFS